MATVRTTVVSGAVFAHPVLMRSRVRGPFTGGRQRGNVGGDEGARWPSHCTSSHALNGGARKSQRARCMTGSPPSAATGATARSSPSHPDATARRSTSWCWAPRREARPRWPPCGHAPPARTSSSPMVRPRCGRARPPSRAGRSRRSSTSPSATRATGPRVGRGGCAPRSRCPGPGPWWPSPRPRAERSRTGTTSRPTASAYCPTRVRPVSSGRRPAPNAPTHAAVSACRPTPTWCWPSAR